MRTHLPAFLLSALIHLGLLAFFLVGTSLLPHAGPPETRVGVSLQMFQPSPPSPAVAEPPSEPVVEPQPEPVAEVLPEPVEPPPPPEPEPIPKPEPAKPKPKPKPKPPKPKPKPPKPKPRPQTAQPRPPVSEAVPQAAVSTAAPTAGEASTSAHPASDASLVRRVEEAYKMALRKAIESHKVYPRRAVRLHQEGEILVGFSIRRDGGIFDLRVVESSGMALLDRAALEAVRQVDGSLPFPKEIERSVWAFTLPISYTLR